MTEIKLSVADIAQLGAKLDAVDLTPNEQAFLGVALGQAANAFAEVQGFGGYGGMGARGIISVGGTTARVGMEAGGGGLGVSLNLFSNLLGGFGAGTALQSEDGSTSIIVVGG